MRYPAFSVILLGALALLSGRTQAIADGAVEDILRKTRLSAPVRARDGVRNGCAKGDFECLAKQENSEGFRALTSAKVEGRNVTFEGSQGSAAERLFKAVDVLSHEDETIQTVIADGFKTYRWVRPATVAPAHPEEVLFSISGNSQGTQFKGVLREATIDRNTGAAHVFDGDPWHAYTSVDRLRALLGRFPELGDLLDCDSYEWSPGYFSSNRCRILGATAPYVPGQKFVSSTGIEWTLVGHQADPKSGSIRQAWRDESTGFVWGSTLDGLHRFEGAASACGSEAGQIAGAGYKGVFTLPSNGELEKARDHGMYEFVTGNRGYFWGTDSISSAFMYGSPPAESGSYVEMSGGDHALVQCVSK
jgi:hypothetical protein